MSLEKNVPYNFSSPTGQEPRHYFRNLCFEFKKTINKTKDSNTLEIEMENIINACKDLKWKEPKNKDVWKKAEGEKALLKLFAEFKRYVKELKENSSNANNKYLLDALDEIIKLIESQKVN
jgi:hypothetical protein